MYKGAGHSTFVTGHSVLRHSQIFVTVKICRLVSTIQIVRAHARDLTMAAAGHAYGMARAVPGITPQLKNLLTNSHIYDGYVEI